MQYQNVSLQIIYTMVVGTIVNRGSCTHCGTTCDPTVPASIAAAVDGCLAQNSAISRVTIVVIVYWHCSTRARAKKWAGKCEAVATRPMTSEGAMRIV